MVPGNTPGSKVMVSAAALPATLLMAPRRLQSPGVAVQAVRLALEVVSTT